MFIMFDALSCSWFSGMPFKLKQREKEIFKINITGLEIPAGWRHTSWLFTSMTEEWN